MSESLRDPTPGPRRATSARSLVGLPAIASLLLIACAAVPARADPGAPSPVLERLPAGAEAYLEIRDLGATLSRLARSSAGQRVGALWASDEGAPLRIARGLLEGLSGMDAAQILAALDGSRIAAARYPSSERDPRPAMLVVKGQAPGLRRVLGVIERFGAARPGPAAGIEPAVAASPGLRIRQRDGLWTAASSEDLATASGTPHAPDPRLRAALESRLPAGEGWLWWTDGARTRALLERLGTLCAIPDPSWAQTRAHFEGARWRAAGLSLEDAAEPRGGLRATLRLIAPGAAAGAGRTTCSGEALRRRLAGAPAGSGDAWDVLVRTLAPVVERIELQRSAAALTEIRFSIVFAPLRAPDERLSPAGSRADSARSPRVPPGRRRAGGG